MLLRLLHQVILANKDEVLHVVRYAQEMTVSEIMAEVKNIANYKLTIDDYLDLMAMWYRDVLVFKSTNDVNPVIFKDELSQIKSQASHFSYEGIAGYTQFNR